MLTRALTSKPVANPVNTVESPNTPRMATRRPRRHHATANTRKSESATRTVLGPNVQLVAVTDRAAVMTVPLIQAMARRIPVAADIIATTPAIPNEDRVKTAAMVDVRA